MNVGLFQFPFYVVYYYCCSKDFLMAGSTGTSIVVSASETEKTPFINRSQVGKSD